MGDGRTEMYKGMWAKTTTIDELRKDLYPIGKAPEKKEVEIDHMPDQYKHKVVSFIKSGIRILGYASIWISIDIGVTLLILAEVVGIGEELV